MTDHAEGGPAPDSLRYRFAELDSGCFIPRVPTGRSSKLLKAAAAGHGPACWTVHMNRPPEDPDD